MDVDLIKLLVLEELFKNQQEIEKYINVRFYSSSLYPLYLLESNLPLRIKDREFYKLAIKKIDHKEMAYTEFEGLQLLFNFRSRTPFPIAIIENENFCLLIMEFIQKGSINEKNKKDLILSLKNLYNHRGLMYGLDKNNYIGILLQKNIETKTFIDFWWGSRIEPMMDLAIEKGYFSNKDKDSLYKIVRQFLKTWKLDDDMPRAIHGDLWSGNILFSGDYAYLIDPSFAYSHPVQDFAMLELFGSPLSFSDYQEIANFCNFILLPEMIEFFQVYPLLVHVNIFGASYKSGIIKFINKHK
jgi:fructosamine-3-kinase